VKIPYKAVCTNHQFRDPVSEPKFAGLPGFMHMSEFASRPASCPNLD
jgi:hypothetical protein